jgi:DNA-binding transcriptional MerR regulator
MAEPGGDPIEPRYKAGDVCRMADVQPYVLRYWESEFAVLAPERGAPGPRLYTPRDVKIIERIKKLLYDEGYTIAGAKKRLEGELKSDGVTMVGAPEPPPPPAPRPRRIAAVPEPVELPSDEPAGVADVELAGGPEVVRDMPIAPSPVPESKRRRARGAVAEAPPAVLFEAPAPPAPAPAARPEEPPDPDLESPTVHIAIPVGVNVRMTAVVDELRQILAILSRDEP